MAAVRWIDEQPRQAGLTLGGAATVVGVCVGAALAPTQPVIWGLAIGLAGFVGLGKQASP